MSGGGVVELSRLVRESPAGGVILLPVEPFGYLLTAPRVFPDLLMWGALAIVINAVIVWVIFLLDADFLESAAARSQVLQARMARARKLGIAAPTGGKAGRSPPMLPYWRGVGPIMWRQVTAALRGSRGLLMVMLIVAMVAGPAVYGARASDSRAIVGTFVGALA